MIFGAFLMILSVSVPLGLLFMAFGFNEGWNTLESIKFGAFTAFLVFTTISVIVTATMLFRYGYSLI